MPRIILLIVISVLLFGMEAGARQSDDAALPETMNLDSGELVLNGAGTRTKLFMDLYIGGLYLGQKSSDAKAITEAEEAMAIKLHIVSGMITSKRMKEATSEGFEASLDGNTAPLREKIDTFIAVFDEEIVKEDVFDLIYLPGVGVKVLKNGTDKETIAGHDFKKAVFGIWLSERPVQKSLKQEMLGL